MLNRSGSDTDQDSAAELDILTESITVNGNNAQEAMSSAVAKSPTSSQDYQSDTPEIEVLTSTEHSPPKLSSSSPLTNGVHGSFAQMTIEEAALADVWYIRCKQTNAELHKAKFGSGSKGKCIKHEADWYTPSEFEAFCGRANSKDWKRSIRFGGLTLHTLIERGYLVPHALSCSCSACLDDASANAPVRHYTPYRRKRKMEGMQGYEGIKVEKLEKVPKDEPSDANISKPFESNLNPFAESLRKISHLKLPSGTQEAWKVLEEAVDVVLNAAVTLKSSLTELKERTMHEAETLRSQIENHVEQSSLIQNQIVAGEPQIVRIFDSNRLQTYTIELMTPDTFKSTSDSGNGPVGSICLSKCENCDREGSLECSGCQNKRYCSAICQRKDWPTHQMFCRDSRQAECKSEPDA